MFLPKLKSYYIILTVLILRSIATYPRITSECRRVTRTISAAGLFQWLFPAANRITRSLAAKSYVSWLTVNWRIESCRCCRVLGGEKNRKQRQWRKTQEPDTWASAHRSKWGQLTPPWKNGWKIKKRKHAKKSSFLCSCYILRAIRGGRCRERRYADHIFVQIYFRMHIS